MQNGRLQNAINAVEGLPFNDKLTLAEYLINQARKDAVHQVTNGTLTNGETSHDVKPSPRDKPDPFRVREYQWLKQHRDEYAGQIVALFDDQLVSHGDNPGMVLDEARQAGYPRALIVRIEAADELPFGGW